MPVAAATPSAPAEDMQPGANMLPWYIILILAIIACIGGGSNSIGMFTPFIKEKQVDIYGVEGAGLGLQTGYHASAIYNNKIGILHGMKTYTMQDEDGKIKDAYSISAGLDYPGIGPEHAYFHNNNRVKYDSIADEEAVEATPVSACGTTLSVASTVVSTAAFTVSNFMNLIRKGKCESMIFTNAFSYIITKF